MEAGELGGVWTESAKKAVELYVESGVRMGKMMLELHERSTTGRRRRCWRRCLKRNAQQANK